MNPERRDLALAAADAAARRLLLRTIDLRFDLDDAAIHCDGEQTPSQEEVWRLRTDAKLLRGAIEALADALSPSGPGAPLEGAEEDEAAAEACGR